MRFSQKGEMMKVNEPFRKVWLIIGILIVLIWLSFPVSATVPGWSEPQTIAEIPDFSDNPHLAYSAPGEWHIVWKETRYLSTSLNDATQWDDIKYLDSNGVTKTIATAERHSDENENWNGYSIGNIDMANDPDGNLGLIYYETYEHYTYNNPGTQLYSTVHLYYSRYINGLWSNPEPIYNEKLRNPRIAFSAPGKWDIVGVHLDTTDTSSWKFKLIYLNSTGYTKTLDSSIDNPSDQEANDIAMGQIASDSIGNLSVIYEKSTLNGVGNVYYTSFINGIWSDPVPNDEMKDGEIAFSAPGKWHIVLNEGEAGQSNLSYINSTGYKGTLASEKKILIALNPHDKYWKGHTVGAADIASDSNGNLSVVYVDRNQIDQSTRSFSLKFMSNDALFTSYNLVEADLVNGKLVNGKLVDGPHMAGGTIVFVPVSKTPQGVNIIKYEWEFGNGVKEVTYQPKEYKRVYDQPEVYKVNLTVTDANNVQSRMTEELNLTLEPGDLILLRSGPPYSTIFDLIGFTYTHVGMYAGKIDGTHYMIESAIGPNEKALIKKDGVQLTTFNRWSVNNKETYADAIKVNVDPETKKRAVAWAMSKLGNKYDFESIPLNLKQLDSDVCKAYEKDDQKTCKKLKDAYYCSELVWAAYYSVSNGNIDLSIPYFTHGAIPPDALIPDGKYPNPYMTAISWHHEHNP
jgi:uncharacterized protein YycO